MLTKHEHEMKMNVWACTRVHKIENVIHDPVTCTYELVSIRINIFFLPVDFLASKIISFVCSDSYSVHTHFCGRSKQWLSYIFVRSPMTKILQNQLKMLASRISLIKTNISEITFFVFSALNRKYWNLCAGLDKNFGAKLSQTTWTAEGTLHEELQSSVAKDLGTSSIKQHGGLHVSAFVRPKYGIDTQ